MRVGKYRPSQIRKAIVVGAGMVAELGNQLVEALADTPTEVHTALTAIVAVATVVGTFAVRNAPIIDAADSFGDTAP